jgi:hypothetical protein
VPLLHLHPSQPYGGHTFPDPSGVPIKGKTLQEMLDAIALYRANNGLPSGNPEKEVEAHYRVVHPHLVTPVGSTRDATEDPVARWLARVWRNPPKEKEFIEAEPLRTRLATCAACEHYVADHAFDADARRRLTILGVGHVTDFGACRAHHWACGLAALIPRHSADPVKGCWA